MINYNIVEKFKEEEDKRLLDRTKTMLEEQDYLLTNVGYGLLVTIPSTTYKIKFRSYTLDMDYIIIKEYNPTIRAEMKAIPVSKVSSAVGFFDEYNHSLDKTIAMYERLANYVAYTFEMTQTAINQVSPPTIINTSLDASIYGQILRVAIHNISSLKIDSGTDLNVPENLERMKDIMLMNDFTCIKLVALEHYSRKIRNTRIIESALHVFGLNGLSRFISLDKHIDNQCTLLCGM